MEVTIPHGIIGHTLANAVTPATARPLLLELFAGLRTVEANQINLTYLVNKADGVLISLRVAGLYGHRIVPVCFGLAAWLQPYLRGPHGIDQAGRFPDRLRRKLGLTHGTLRRNYASNRLAIGTPIEQLWVEMGVKSELACARPLWLPVTSGEAKRFFALTPVACGRPKWAEEVETWREHNTSE